MLYVKGAAETVLPRCTKVSYIAHYVSIYRSRSTLFYLSIYLYVYRFVNQRRKEHALREGCRRDCAPALLQGNLHQLTNIRASMYISKSVPRCTSYISI